MRLLDLFCCQGGASAGYAQAGWDVTGVDIDPQPRYPYMFVQADAIEYVKAHGHEFDAISASPPCQAHSKAQRIMGREHPKLIAPAREALIATGRPWVIENVEEARPELVDPVMLCGVMFGLRTYRHRLFETGGGFALDVPAHPFHSVRTVKMGRALTDRDFYHAVGNFSGVSLVREDMGMPWASREGLREAIPPAYAEWIGRQLLEWVSR
ncbi:DNA cytosine methyltransferase [Phytomonospora sp. NPDC050363]|uniref:DNA cytosine methyltransferase n=1 Tax=Phytomonospora sp. NPDC050363 TaxID=3155642 RepID=UPI0033CBC02D